MQNNNKQQQTFPVGTLARNCGVDQRQAKTAD